jgi:hypothetical protein
MTRGKKIIGLLLLVLGVAFAASACGPDVCGDLTYCTGTASDHL